MASSSTSPIQSRLLSSINERLVMRAIQERGPLTRAEVTKSIGITFPTATKAVSSLLDAKLLEEYDDAPGGPGRPAKRLRLATDRAQVIGVTLSDSECLIVAAGLDGAFEEEQTDRFDTPGDYPSLLDAIAAHAEAIMARDDKATLCLGVSVPGIVDYKEQLAVLSANLPIVNGKRIGIDLGQRLGVECLVVRDAHAFSLSERLRYTLGDNTKTVAMLDHSEGIGLGLMIDRAFVTGERGFAGELGHIPMVVDGEMCHCGKVGCLETVASEWALEARVSRVIGREVRIDELLDLALAGERRIIVELEAMCAHLARGVACVVNIFNPGVFCIYGRCFRRMPGLLDRLVAETKRHSLEPSFNACVFAPASGGEMDGTIASVIHHLTESLVPDLEPSSAGR